PYATEYEIAYGHGDRMDDFIQKVVDSHRRVFCPAGDAQLQREFLAAALVDRDPHATVPRVVGVLRQAHDVPAHEFRPERAAAVKIHPDGAVGLAVSIA